MGLIKAFTEGLSTSIGDQFKEYVICPEVKNDVLIQRGLVKHGSGNTNPTEGIITNGSTIVVPQGMAMMLIQNGEIKEFSSEPGEYTWDSGSEPSVFTGGFFQGVGDTIKNIGKRFTYGGLAPTDQRVYYVNIKTIPGNLFGSSQPVPIADPLYGMVEVTYHGEYALRVKDPVILVNNVIGSNPKDTLTYDDVFKTDGNNMLKTKFAQKVGEAISTIMTMHNVSYTRIHSYTTDITDRMNEIMDDELFQKYGIIIEDVALSPPTPSDESLQMIRDMEKEVTTTRRMAEVYSNNMQGAMAAASATAMKNAAGNEGGAMMGFMGMNMATMQANNMMGAVGGYENQPQQTNQAQPQPGTIFPQQPQQPVQNPTVNETPVQPEPTTATATGAIYCPNCGTKLEGGNFCTSCGQKLN